MTAAQEPVVVGRGARVWRGERVVVDGLDLVAYPGAVHALVGDNGAGKSSVLLALTGALRSTFTVRAAAVGYAPQRLVPPAFLPLTVRDVVKLLRRRADDGVVRAVLDAAGLGAAVTGARPLAALSGGELARLFVALACGAGAKAPALVLLDEPSASVDAGAREIVDGLVRDARAQGSAVLLVSHDERQVQGLADVVTRIGGAS